MDLERDHEPDDGGVELTSREPSLEDLLELCAELNRREAKYVVVGGFAIRASGYPRRTMDIDLVIATDLDNEQRVYAALEILPDKAVRELDPGDVAKFIVVRVADEVLVDLMRSAGGIEYEEAAQDAIVREVEGVAIPFASPRLLWRMKARTHREKDAPDLLFLRNYFAARGEEPPRMPD
ncbi:MAG: nucleotidyltransferase [Verrucomicrobiota bacterium]|nr:nucleotidyltransferase [Verrucomicrobiota bacterium]